MPARLPQLDAIATYTRNSDVPELTITAPGRAPSTLFPNIPDNYRTRAPGSLSPSTPVAGSRPGSRRPGSSTARRPSTPTAPPRTWSWKPPPPTWPLVTARESDRVLAEAVAAYEAHLKDAHNRLDLGMAASNEVLSVQVERDRAELARLQAGNQAAVANANLLRLMGLQQDASLEPTEPLDALVPAEVAPDAEALSAEASQGRPELLALRARLAAADAGVRAPAPSSCPRRARRPATTTPTPTPASCRSRQSGREPGAWA